METIRWNKDDDYEGIILKSENNRHVHKSSKVEISPTSKYLTYMPMREFDISESFLDDILKKND